MLFILQKLKELPDTWLVCFTILIFPISTAASYKFAFTDTFSYKRGDTEINLGQVAKRSDRLSQRLLERNESLIEANENLQDALRKRRIKIPEIAEVEKAITATEEVASDVKENSKDLKEIAEEIEVVPNVN